MGKPPSPPGHGGSPPPGHGGTPPGQGKPPEPEQPPSTEPPPEIGGGPVEPPPVIDGEPIIPPEQPPTEPPPDIEEPPPDLVPPDRDDMRCIIRIGGTDYEYDAAAGTDLGAFQDCIGPMVGLGRRFAMSCHRVTRDDCPIRVDFRAVEGWWCACFDYGDAFGETGAKNLGPMTVAIGGKTIELWGHPWGVRWRWQPGPWPFDIIPTADLIAAGLLLEYDPEVPCGTAPHGFTATYAPLEFASVGLEPRMPNTGARQDIGLTTDLQAQYINGACDLSGVLAQGEACASVPWRLYDPAKGRTIDMVREHQGQAIEGGKLQWQVPSLLEIDLSGPAEAAVPGMVTIRKPDGGAFDCGSWTSGTLGPSGERRCLYAENGWAAADPTGGSVDTHDGNIQGVLVAGSYVRSSGIFPESAHEPALSYLPFILTGDPYHLENLQAQAQFAFAELGTGYPNTYTPGIIQTRAAAWNFRSIYQAAAVTPADAPSWLLSRDAMTAAFDWCVHGMTQMMTNPPQAELQSVFHHINTSHWCEQNCWMMDFYILVSAAATRLHEAWRPILQFVVQNAIARLDGRSGWHRGNPDPYTVWFGPGQNAPPWHSSWAEAGEHNGGPEDLDMAAPWSGQMDYINGLRACLAAATQVLADDDPLLAEVRACLDYLTPYHRSWLRNGQLVEYKWSHTQE